MNTHDTIELVVIYADIVGSTNIVNKLPPEKIPLFYKLFSNEVSRVIKDFGGVVYKYVGDEIIGVFLIPETRWIPIFDNSIRCISYIRDVTNYVISPLAQDISLPKIQCRIGADYGEAQIVNIGVDGVHLSAEILGNVMNIAAKIRGKAEPGEITIGENYRQQLHVSYKLICNKIEPLIINEKEYDVFHIDFSKLS